MSLKRVFIDATGIGLRPTGLGKYSYCLLKAIAGDKRQPFDLTILHQACLPKSHALFALACDRIAFLPFAIPVIGPKRDILFFYNLSKTINRYNLYHCLSSYLPAFGIDIPSLVTIHDLKYLRFPKLFANCFKAKYYGWIIRRGTHKATNIIAVSTATKNDLVALGVSPKKIYVIREASTISLSNSTSRTMPPCPISEPFFLYVGDNRPHKNILRLLQAYRDLISKLGHNCPSLVFVGAQIEDSYGSHANAHERKIFFLGAIHDETLFCLYKHALALVYPSLYEGFGLPILEAMSVGTPVITSNCSAMSEVAGNAAILVDPLDVGQLSAAMMRIVEDGPGRKRLRQLGIRRSHDFSWRQTAQQTLSLYSEILK